jgi:predicted RNA polymerase sigma factor
MSPSELFWMNFCGTFPQVFGVVLALLPALVLVLGTVALGLRLYHTRQMARTEAYARVLGLDEEERRHERDVATVRLRGPA